MASAAPRPTMASLLQRIETLEAIVAALAPSAAQRDLANPVSLILRDICEVTGLTADEIKSQRQTPELVRARHAAAWLAREATVHSFPQIGRVLNRDHTTIQSNARQGELRRRRDDDFLKLTNQLLAAARRRSLGGSR
jgi:chromosomal replication initiation ATPase DnaA